MRLPTILTTAALLAMGAPGAHAMTCHDYVRANVLQDPDGMDTARSIIEPLAVASWPSASGQSNPAGIPLLYWRTITQQLQRECQQLPDETLDDIVATHLRAAQRQRQEAAAAEQAQAIEAARAAGAAARYELYGNMLHQVSDLTCRDYRNGGAKAATIVRFVLAWAAVEDDHKDDPMWRREMHGDGAPHLPHLGMTQDEAVAGLTKWCSANAKQFIMGRKHATEEIYADARMARFGAEVEDTPAKTAEKAQWAADQTADLAKWHRDEALARRVGPEDSCPWNMFFMKDGRPVGDDMASYRERAVWDYCNDHPRASKAQLRAVVPDR